MKKWVILLALLICLPAYAEDKLGATYGGLPVPGTSGQILGTNGTVPEWETLSGGNGNCTITRNGAGSYSLNCSSFVTTAGSGFTAGGDLSGTSTTQTVIGIQQKPVPLPASGYLHYNGTAFVWDTPAGGGGFTAGGDLSGTSTSQTVVGLQTKALPAPTTGYLWYNGTALSWNPASGMFAPLTNPANGQNNYAPIDNPVFTTQVVAPYGGLALAGINPPPTDGYVFIRNLNTTSTQYTVNVPLNNTTLAGLNMIETWTAAQTFNQNRFILAGSSTGTTTINSANSSASNYAINVPAVSDTLAVTGTAQTFLAAQTFPNAGIIQRGTSTGNLTITNADAGATNYTATFPNNTGTVAELNLTQTWTQVQTYNQLTLAILGSSTGATTFNSANSTATAYTATFPANTGTIAELNLAQTWTVAQTFSVPITVASGGTNTGTAPSAGQLLVAQSATAYAPVTVSGDESMTTTGVTTNTGLKGVAVPTLASGYLHYTGAAFAWDTPAGPSAPTAWTPTAAFSGGGCTVAPTFGTTVGWYVTSGKVATVYFYIPFTGAGTTCAGQLQITNLPFTPYSSLSPSGVSEFPVHATGTSAGGVVRISVQASSGSGSFWSVQSGSYSTIGQSQVSATTVLSAMMTYITN